MKPTQSPHVILRACPNYDVARIRQIVKEGLDTLGLKPFGRTLVKPNLVAAGKLFPHAHTRPEFAEGVLLALQDAGRAEMSELAVGERCGITIPTRLAFKESGFDSMLERLENVKKYHFEEEKQVEVRLTHEKRLRDYLYTPEPVARADFFVNLPKFKAHPWTTVTFSMKNYIGIQDDRHRLIDHDHRLNEKVADLQYIIQPQFIAIDAITAGEGRMLTPAPFQLGLIVMGNSQVAFDAVCCAIIGVEPRSVDHIRLAEERGFGTTELSKIQISGDVTLDDARKKAKGFKVGLVRVEKYFEGTKISAYAGPPPESEHTDYCWGGCPGAIEEAIEILRLFDQGCDERMPRMHVAFGDYKGEIPAKEGEVVIFIGDCAQWKGKLGDELVEIRSQYQPRHTKDPHQAQHSDIYAKMLAVAKNLRATRKAGVRYFRMGGCPVSVAEQVLALAELGKTKNPYFDPNEVLGFNKAYLTWKMVMAARKLAGKKYQEAGAIEHGHARPDMQD